MSEPAAGLPPGLAAMAKDLLFPPPGVAGPLAARIAASGGSPVDALSAALMACHESAGAQMMVEPDVLADLLESDIGTACFGRVPWPAPVLEMVFAGAPVPSFLIGIPGADVMERAGVGFAAAGRRSGEPAVILVAQGRDAAGPCAMTVRYTPAEMDDYAMGRAEAAVMGAEGLDGREADALRFLALLAYKVLAFCAVPALRPLPNAAWTRRSGGKPGFRNRPARPSLRVAYLPSARADLTARREPREGARARSFLGRRGHLHWYRSERFVNRAGSFDFFPPIPGPGGRAPRRRFVVRRPRD